MFDLRPAGYVIGILIMALGGAMVLPMAMDLIDGHGNWVAMGLSAFTTVLIGGAIALCCHNATTGTLNIQQTFFLTTGVWLVLPVFGALPFVWGATDARFVDAFFEAMSGLTTTGSTVFTGLETLPRGLLLWRGLMQWFGGIGVVVVAMVFLPVLRVGGMQIFRTEGFDTFGKILPRAAEISRSISSIYLCLTLICMVAYSMAGMGLFDASVHAMTTIATGGFANYDNSFGDLGAAAEYIAVVFMILAALPFVRYVQLLGGSVRPIWADPQIRGFIYTLVIVVGILVAWRWYFITNSFEFALRKAAFNGVSILTGTGYASADYMTWGAFPITFFFLIGLIGGCAGSTTCSIKIFRFQLLFASISAQIKRIHSPHGIFKPRYNKTTVQEDVVSSVMAFLVLFLVTLAVLAVALGMTGLNTITSISGAAAALANIGPGLGSEIGPAGNFAGLNDNAKWILAAGMLIGRLELMAVYVLFTATFWRG
ncbi:Trk system potassium uptake protein [Amylibacter marinus]|uniref:Trk system potassium uptake protein n=1 Tax=Amylibacter marinus TaxID=1475483 RepID=A0ABQ5VTU4_9RHOB|nr:TrkH family potassium uptake protein [Amylibacter marinus]GLQ34579.1 Trk system potassium uptake protein [Amylibacter marinus]